MYWNTSTVVKILLLTNFNIILDTCQNVNNWIRTSFINSSKEGFSTRENEKVETNQVDGLN